jgi:hypothetical protein
MPTRMNSTRARLLRAFQSASQHSFEFFKEDKATRCTQFCAYLSGALGESHPELSAELKKLLELTPSDKDKGGE